jgi:hypothetical protein
MLDNLLAVTDREEALSRAYAYAVAARAGYSTAMYAEDRDGIDFRIQAGGGMRPALDLQLKATFNLGRLDDGCFRFPLNRRNYDLLRIEAQTPRLLMVLDLPRDKNLWMTITADELVMRRSAYWLNLKGYPETDNLVSITVRIPERNLFDVKNLRMLMEQSRVGVIQ